MILWISVHGHQRWPEFTPPPTSGFREKIVRLALRFDKSKQKDRTIIITVIIHVNQPLCL